MSSRADILARVKTNKPKLLNIPNIALDVFEDGRDLLKEFTVKVETAGGQVFETQSKDLVVGEVQKLFPEAKVNFSTLENTEDFNTINLEAIKTPHDLEDLDVLIVESNVGVAENGAIWLNDALLPMRILPFITKHLVVILKKDDLVTFMHQAYQKLNGEDTGFGVFLSGPSKTADIEQSLVIGAHGALSLSVFLV
ncbi:lactate utilization protein C [Mariniflexile gromovii]|uniref:LUD domain-containing protein n=1 Tax=Mariniflexile gromovii TaxID=362523 RepID=A0ABS4BWH6_9FLAO|nr:LUD domain-containing protein [Mariniflexile gromovii]MBP0904940.1 LUD domain-containing protein [Mariniflexile gromovii]